MRGVARKGATTRPPPGGAKGDPRASDDFQRWNGQYGPGTYPEYLIFRRLERDGYRHGNEFTYQMPFGGGRIVHGAQITDFVVFDYLAWSVLGWYYHFQRDPAQRQRDVLNRNFLTSLGYLFVEMLDLDIVDHLEPIYQLALKGMETTGAQLGVPIG